jgi:hypothetical protein
MEKKCTKCNIIKPLDSFGLNRDNRTGKAYRRGYCKTCKNREKQLKKYNLTVEKYNTLYETYKGKCPICKNFYSKLVIDHCHRTGKVRGLLCDSCNKLLGFAKDNFTILHNAVLYLEER